MPVIEDQLQKQEIKSTQFFFSSKKSAVETIGKHSSLPGGRVHVGSGATRRQPPSPRADPFITATSFTVMMAGTHATIGIHVSSVGGILSLCVERA